MQTDTGMILHRDAKSAGPQGPDTQQRQQETPGTDASMQTSGNALIVRSEAQREVALTSLARAESLLVEANGELGATPGTASHMPRHQIEENLQLLGSALENHLSQFDTSDPAVAAKVGAVRENFERFAEELRAAGTIENERVRDAANAMGESLQALQEDSVILQQGEATRVNGAQQRVHRQEQVSEQQEQQSHQAGERLEDNLLQQIKAIRAALDASNEAERKQHTEFLGALDALSQRLDNGVGAEVSKAMADLGARLKDSIRSSRDATKAALERFEAALAARDAESGELKKQMGRQGEAIERLTEVLKKQGEGRGPDDFNALAAFFKLFAGQQAHLPDGWLLSFGKSKKP